MEFEGKVTRFSSCRGVAFEIKPHADLFAIVTPMDDEIPRSQRLWDRIPRALPNSLSRRSSSHFCDLDNEEEEESADDDALVHIEEALQLQIAADKLPELPLTKSKSQHRKPSSNKHNSSRLSVILLDQGLFTVYKRLFALSLIINITCLVLASFGKFSYARTHAVTFSVANIFALVLCRSEAFFRVIFYLAVKTLGYPSVPLRVKLGTTAILQSVGGIHSGCGVSSVAWLIYSLVLTLKDRSNTSPEIIGVASTILGLLSLSCIGAFPLVRHLHHNVFERIHRFAGWTSLVLVWIFIYLTTAYDPVTKSYRTDIGSELAKKQEFWFVIGITILIILPWLTLRKVPVMIYSPSGHASVITFQGGVGAGILGRISPSPLSEWHAFGIISDNMKEHVILAGAVGDFTKSLVSNPPSHLWVRQLHFAGLPYLTNMYNRVLHVATGSGICPFLSFQLQPCRADICVLWVAKNMEQNFGKEIMEWMSRRPEKNILHDTALLGRPNVPQMSVETAKKFGAEIVIVTSNPEGTRDIVNACWAAGIPAFGPIWDS